VRDHRSRARDHRSRVRDHRSRARDHRSRVRDHRSRASPSLCADESERRMVITCASMWAGVSVERTELMITARLPNLRAEVLGQG